MFLFNSRLIVVKLSGAVTQGPGDCHWAADQLVHGIKKQKKSQNNIDTKAGVFLFERCCHSSIVFSVTKNVFRFSVSFLSILPICLSKATYIQIYLIMEEVRVT